MKGNKFYINPTNNTLSTVYNKAIGSKEIVEESNAGYIAYVDSFNLFVNSGNNNKKVTSDGGNDIVYGSSVHRDEFGISKGTFWSNDGKKLAFYRMDQSMVSDYPIIDWSEKPAKVVNIKYPMAGEKSHHVTIGVYNAETGNLLYLQTGEPAEQYLTNIAWSPDNRNIFVAVVNREQNHMRLNQYDAATGAFIKTLFEEKDDKYVEPMVPMLFVKNKPSQFIWESSRDGFNHLYLYDISGNVIKQLTQGAFEVIEVKGFDQKGENLYFVSNETSPINRDLYVVNLKSGKRSRITNGKGVHIVQVSNSGKYILDVASSTENARMVQMIETATGKTVNLLTAANPLANYSLGRWRYLPLMVKVVFLFIVECISL
jgi:dipeptidyl-peptidase-4